MISKVQYKDRRLWPAVFAVFMKQHPKIKSGGVDFDAAKEAGVKVIWALSLPGKTAPITAGKIIKDTILNILNELEV